MLRIRLFEERSVELQSTGQMPGFVHIAIGQEAEVVGASMALHESDYMTGNHRSHAHPIAKGAQLAPLMAELLGKETGVCRGKGGSMHLAVFSVGSLGESGIVGSLMPVAVGAGLSARLRGTRQICLCFFGDGAANCGPFHESMNLASIWKLPVVFLCENNGYATTTAQSQSTAVKDIACRAASYGIPGIVVDGQDVLAVFAVVSDAVRRARGGDGPTLVETKTYRYREHSEFNGRIPEYRSPEEVASWKQRDPIVKFSTQLIGSRHLSQDEFSAMRLSVVAEVDDAVVFAQRSNPPHPGALYEDIFV